MQKIYRISLRNNERRNYMVNEFLKSIAVFVGRNTRHPIRITTILRRLRNRIVRPFAKPAGLNSAHRPEIEVLKVTHQAAYGFQILHPAIP